jgi:hypothetical protein
MELGGRKRLFCLSCAGFLDGDQVQSATETRLEDLEWTLRWVCQRYVYSQALLHKVVESYRSHLEAAAKERQETEALRQRQTQHMETMEGYAAETADYEAQEAMEREWDRQMDFWRR